MREPLKLINWLAIIAILPALTISIWKLPFGLAFISTLSLLAAAALIFIPTTVRRRAAPKDAANLLRITDALDEGVIVYDSGFTILIFNAAAERIFSIQRGDIVGQSFTLKVKRRPSPKFHRLLTILFPALAQTIIRRSKPGTFPQIADITFENPQLELRVATHRLTDENGRIIGYAKVIANRTRELNLLHTKSEFISIASHQLQTPIAALSWALSSLRNESLSKSQNTLIVNMASAVNQLTKTVGDLIDVANIEKGSFGYRFSEHNIESFIQEALERAKPIADQYRVKLYFEKPQEELPHVFIDPPKLSIVFQNLLDNAIKYNVPNGEVIARITRITDMPYIEVAIRDTGIGIPPDSINQVFTKFFRAENAAKLIVNGAGLDLYIAKNIVRAHGGTIKVESTVNRGSTFTFTLPTDKKLVPQKEIFSDDV